ncbi:MAG: glucose-6-phosphate isomerase [Gammaproteobacteria bacterium]|nr:glucose-6-phosphate isomerase [Gammaproteobacteria bacterium]MBP9728846.1 glucose-6-phosphate isomerase [Gammaproteobacteria bacterium]
MREKMWQALHAHQQRLVGLRIPDFFANDPQRFEHCSIQACGLLFDFSKQYVQAETITTLCALAEACDLQGGLEALFTGKSLNISEQRPALHTALRDPTLTPCMVFGRDLKQAIRDQHQRMGQFVQRLQSGNYLGFTHKPITDVICLGIGGSALGPSMVCRALAPYKNIPLRCHFVSNIDGHTLAATLGHLDPEKTLCMVSSKTFKTLETLTNAEAVRQWFKKILGPSCDQHCVAITANPSAAEALGFSKEQIFEFWDCIGGRYSVWSAVGLPIALSIGMEHFNAFLAGAYAMDQHIRSTPFSQNMPVLMGLLGIWNINVLGSQTQAIIPYEDGLGYLPAYLQQLEMESNGKQPGVGSLGLSTGAVIWGGVGCDAQHAYMQLLHQGTQIVPVDFLVAAQGHPDFPQHQAALVASCLSQSKALMEGVHAKDTQNTQGASAHDCPGNRPSSTLMYERLTPAVLGSLIALYEHKVFVQSQIWSINPFDQWGVEGGKRLLGEILPALENPQAREQLDTSSQGLIDYFLKHR